jgi:hypothetical protein
MCRLGQSLCKCGWCCSRGCWNCSGEGIHSGIYLLMLCFFLKLCHHILYHRTPESYVLQCMFCTFFPVLTLGKFIASKSYLVLIGLKQIKPGRITRKCYLQGNRESKWKLMCRYQTVLNIFLKNMYAKEKKSLSVGPKLAVALSIGNTIPNKT